MWVAASIFLKKIAVHFHHGVAHPGHDHRGPPLLPPGVCRISGLLWRLCQSGLQVREEEKKRPSYIDSSQH